ncbi:CaiF/GrlA family transcriptional regulator [Enterobacter hormaechei]|nr:CaiF/GrlA family transcriptional regulator [Enterobacter hormaechei]
MNKNLPGDYQRDINISKIANVVAGRQSNHGSFYLPASISHLKSPAFYMAVAWWGLLKKDAFTRHDIASAFRVTPRRAADVMTYLATAVPSDVVRTEKKVVRMGSGRSVLFMTIYHVSGDIAPVPRPTPVVAPRKGRREASQDYLAARDLFLGRRPRTAG